MGSFESGMRVVATCYHEGCENVSLEVTLGRSEYIEPGCSLGRGVGRLRWPADTPRHEVFSLAEQYGGSGRCRCPSCNTEFASVVIVGPPGKEPLIFCYEPEPA